MDAAKIKSLFEVQQKDTDKKRNSTCVPKKISILSLNRAQSIGILLKHLPPIPVIRKSIESLDRYIQNLNDYSNHGLLNIYHGQVCSKDPDTNETII